MKSCVLLCRTANTAKGGGEKKLAPAVGGATEPAARRISCKMRMAPPLALQACGWRDWTASLCDQQTTCYAYDGYRLTQGPRIAAKGSRFCSSTCRSTMADGGALLLYLYGSGRQRRSGLLRFAGGET